MTVCAVFDMSDLSVCLEQCKAPSNTRKHSVSKSLRHLFQPTSKFVKNLKRWAKTTSDDGCWSDECSQHTMSCIIYDSSLSLILSVEAFIWPVYFIKMKTFWWLQRISCLSSRWTTHTAVTLRIYSGSQR